LSHRSFRSESTNIISVSMHFDFAFAQNSLSSFNVNIVFVAQIFTAACSYVVSIFLAFQNLGSEIGQLHFVFDFLAALIVEVALLTVVACVEVFRIFGPVVHEFPPDIAAVGGGPVDVVTLDRHFAVVVERFAAGAVGCAGLGAWNVFRLENVALVHMVGRFLGLAAPNVPLVHEVVILVSNFVLGLHRVFIVVNFGFMADVGCLLAVAIHGGE